MTETARNIWHGETGPAAFGSICIPGLPTAGLIRPNSDVDSKYSNADDIYGVLVEAALTGIQDDKAFDKKIYSASD